MVSVSIDYHIDKESIIHIFKTVFISSFEKVILIKNGLGNRPYDAVATDSDFVGMPGAKSCSPIGGKDEMKKSLYLFISSEEVFCFKLKEKHEFKIRNTK